MNNDLLLPCHIRLYPSPIHSQTLSHLTQMLGCVHEVLSGNDGCRFVVVTIKNRFLFACMYVCRGVRVKVCVRACVCACGNATFASRLRYPRLNLKAHGLGLMDLTASTMITHTDLLQHRDNFGVVPIFGIIESCHVILPPRGECM